jgi:PHD/YefM family antitoxin component YafN of YafNO toxin-antitoxin module
MHNIFRMIREVNAMPNIKSSTDLRNNYNEISTFCHESREPVFITKNGQGDLAVMSIETYEALSGKLELYRLLDEGRAAVKAGKKRPLQEVMKDIKRGISDGEI